MSQGKIFAMWQRERGALETEGSRLTRLRFASARQASAAMTITISAPEKDTVTHRLARGHDASIPARNDFNLAAVSRPQLQKTEVNRQDNHKHTFHTGPAEHSAGPTLSSQTPSS